MKIKSKALPLVSFLLIAFAQLAGKEDHRVEDQPQALALSQTLPNQGILRKKENGFIYLDVSNEFITAIIPRLDLEGNIRPLPTASRSLGAHISVFDEREQIIPNELNTYFSFDVDDIRTFTLHTRDGLKKLWVVCVHSIELEQLRKKYVGKEKLKGYDFHIKLGKQIPAAPSEWRSVNTISSFNDAEDPTVGLSDSGDFTTVEHENIIATALKVNAIGQLCLKGNGFVYLDVSNQLIQDIWPQLPLQSEFDPVSTNGNKIGAHISVIHEDEMIGHEIWDLKEAGEWFTFEVKELRYIDRKTPNGKIRLWLLAADSPGLERLRRHYGLKPKMQGHDFHITLGSEKLDMEDKETVADPAAA